MCIYPQVTSLWSDYLRLLLRVASPMPLLSLFDFFFESFTLSGFDYAVDILPGVYTPACNLLLLRS